MTVTPAEYGGFMEHGGVADLSWRAKFRLTGADRIRFLNGQVTANVTRLTPGAALPACITTAKGRLNGEIFINAQGDALFVDAEASLRETLLARLEKYLISDDVVLEDVTGAYTLLHFLRRHPGQEAGSAAPARTNRFGQEGWDLWLPAGTDSPAPTVSSELLEVLRIEAGLPRWGRELGEETLPAEAGLDRTHIDFHKGCYIGQEVISRIESVGHVNRQLTGFVSLSGEALPAGGLLSPLSDSAQKLGALTSATWSFALAKPIALGYLKRGSPENLLVHPVSGHGAAIEVTACDLPFVTP